MAIKKIQGLFQKFKKGNNEGFYDLPVLNTSLPTAQSKKIDLEIPDTLVDSFQWKAGQYITLRIEHKGKIYYRDYSLCNLPHEGVASICVKQTTQGHMSKWLVENIQKGDILQVSEPKGNFTLALKPNEKRTLVAFAAGSGITPIFSIIQDVLANEPNAHFYLFYGNKNPENTIFLDSLLVLQQKHSGQFHPYFFYSQQETPNPIFTGRIDTHKIDLLINQILDWDEIDEILICGPNELSVNIRQDCLDRGMHTSQIHIELFTPLENKKLVTQKNQSPVTVEVLYEGKNHTLVWEDFSHSLLDAVLNKGIEVPYSCKGGVCGTCVCHKKGTAHMGEQLVLVDSEIEEGQFLPCVCFKAKGDISLDFDQH